MTSFAYLGEKVLYICCCCSFRLHGSHLGCKLRCRKHEISPLSLSLSLCFFPPKHRSACTQFEQWRKFCQLGRGYLEKQHFYVGIIAIQIGQIRQFPGRTHDVNFFGFYVRLVEFQLSRIDVNCCSASCDAPLPNSTTLWESQLTNTYLRSKSITETGPLGFRPLTQLTKHRGLHGGIIRNIVAALYS